MSPLAVKPQSKPKMQTFYGLKEGSAETVTIKFEANPKPTEVRFDLMILMI